jgi:hypothetical protein
MHDIAEPKSAGNVLKPEDRAKWYAQVLGDIERLQAFPAREKITAYDYVVAVLIGQRMDKTGVAYPGYAYLAKKAAVTVRFVQESVRRLECHGHLRIDRHRTVHFTLTLRSTNAQMAEPTKPKPKKQASHPATPETKPSNVPMPHTAADYLSYSKKWIEACARAGLSRAEYRGAIQKRWFSGSESALRDRWEFTLAELEEVNDFVKKMAENCPAEPGRESVRFEDDEPPF